MVRFMHDKHCLVGLNAGICNINGADERLMEKEAAVSDRSYSFYSLNNELPHQIKLILNESASR